MAEQLHSPTTSLTNSREMAEQLPSSAVLNKRLLLSTMTLDRKSVLSREACVRRNRFKRIFRRWRTIYHDQKLSRLATLVRVFNILLNNSRRRGSTTQRQLRGQLSASTGVSPRPRHPTVSPTKPTTISSSVHPPKKMHQQKSQVIVTKSRNAVPLRTSLVKSLPAPLPFHTENEAVDAFYEVESEDDESEDLHLPPPPPLPLKLGYLFCPDGEGSDEEGAVSANRHKISRELRKAMLRILCLVVAATQRQVGQYRLAAPILLCDLFERRGGSEAVYRSRQNQHQRLQVKLLRKACKRWYKWSLLETWIRWEAVQATQHILSTAQTKGFRCLRARVDEQARQQRLLAAAVLHQRERQGAWTLRKLAFNRLVNSASLLGLAKSLENNNKVVAYRCRRCLRAWRESSRQAVEDFVVRYERVATALESISLIKMRHSLIMWRNHVKFNTDKRSTAKMVDETLNLDRTVCAVGQWKVFLRKKRRQVCVLRRANKACVRRRIKCLFRRWLAVSIQANLDRRHLRQSQREIEQKQRLLKKRQRVKELGTELIRQSSWRIISMAWSAWKQVASLSWFSSLAKLARGIRHWTRFHRRVALDRQCIAASTKYYRAGLLSRGIAALRVTVFRRREHAQRNRKISSSFFYVSSSDSESSPEMKRANRHKH